VSLLGIFLKRQNPRSFGRTTSVLMWEKVLKGGGGWLRAFKKLKAKRNLMKYKKKKDHISVGLRRYNLTHLWCKEIIRKRN
jgi:hypothetical protein